MKNVSFEHKTESIFTPENVTLLRINTSICNSFSTHTDLQFHHCYSAYIGTVIFSIMVYTCIHVCIVQCFPVILLTFNAYTVVEGDYEGK